MSSLPAFLVNGNVSDEADFNLVKSARNGNFNPIDPIIKNEIDDTYDLGTDLSRWADINISNNLIVGAQPYLNASIQSGQVVNPTLSKIVFNAPSTIVGTDIVQVSTTQFLVNKSGVFYCECQLNLNVAFISQEINLNLERPSGVLFDFWHDSTNRQKTTKVFCFFDALANDEISVGAAANQSNTTTGGYLKILRLF